MSPDPNSYDAFHYDAQSFGANVALHAWNRGSSARHRYALYLLPGAQHEFGGGCAFEGAYAANVCITSARNIFDHSTRYFAAWNGVNIYLGLIGTQNVIKGFVDAPGAGRTTSVGIVLGSNSGDFISAN
jgi:hypothetical protein